MSMYYFDLHVSTQSIGPLISHFFAYCHPALIDDFNASLDGVLQAKN
jgi:hypothetical protein